MTTYTALTRLMGKAAAQTLGEAMETLSPEPTGVGVFEIQDGSDQWEVGGYFQAPPDEAGLALLSAVHGCAPFAVTALPEEDWVAKVKRELTPVRAGRFFVYGSHDAEQVPEGCESLLIEAAMAFGTGHHGTTQGCLMALDKLLQDGFAPQNVADIGCGTAVLAMAAARVWDVPILASDIDETAVEVARTNVVANGLDGRVVCLEAAGFGHPNLATTAPFGLIFANILKGPLIALSGEVMNSTAPGGKVILSGILNEQADEVIGAYQLCGAQLERRDEIGEWTTLTLGKA